jgi:hypothetical protein
MYDVADAGIVEYLQSRSQPAFGQRSRLSGFESSFKGLAIFFKYEVAPRKDKNELVLVDPLTPQDRAGRYDTSSAEHQVSGLAGVLPVFEV